MSDISKAYNALASSSSRTDVANVLQSIIDALPFAFDQTTRQELIQALLKDVKTSSTTGGASKGRLTPKDAPQALLAVKTLGKQPSGSEVLATPTNLSILLTLSTASSFKDYPNASSEALRCVANALLLIDTARITWVSKEVGGGEASVALLEKSTSPDQIFLASRILFLCTASSTSSASYIRSLVEGKHHGNAGTIVEIIGAKLDALTTAILSGTKMAREAMTDLLKFTFNLLLHYPKLVDCELQQPSQTRDSEDEAKVMGDYWSPKLDGILPPLLRVFNSLPPTFPAPLAAPLTHAIHGLITIPVSPSLRSVWLGNGVPATSSSNSSRSGRSSTSNSNSPKPQRPQVVTNAAAGSSSSSRSDSPIASATSGSSTIPSPKSGAIDRALSVLAAGRRSLSRSPSPLPAIPDILLRAFDLLEVSLSHYFPGDIDPDDPEVRERCRAECGDTTLDELISPLVVLITRLCIADETSRVRTREWIVPVDLDRTGPLEARSDLLGRCLRLLGSVYNARLKDAIGEMLFAMCDSDAACLSSHVGYGNVAGFLFHKGIMNAPSPTVTSSNPLTTPSGAAINPITGTEFEKVELPDMTQEEKEREAEKLFVLFERLEKTGALPPSQNPIRKAIAEGKIGPGSREEEEDSS